jgi:hypothetical protein
MQVIHLGQKELAERWRNATPHTASPPSRRLTTRCTWDHSIFFELARRRDGFQANCHP